MKPAPNYPATSELTDADRLTIQRIKGEISEVAKTGDARQNREFGICGRLWQGRFFFCAMDDSRLWAATRYVERNPVRASMVAGAEDYPWSSATAHCRVHSDPLLSALPEPRPTSVTDWSKWPTGKDDEKMLATLRLNTRTGRPACAKGLS